ncbi:MAG TPA: MFS transporter [Sphingomonas sp.]|nr:MFS transporter [Sphingomonas sp.]
MPHDPRRLAIALSGLCTFINLYATQPLLPLFARDFNASAAEVSLTISASTLAVALVAPFVGVVADVMGRKRIITGAMALMVIPTALAALSTSIGELVLWRFAQGLLLPPIFAVTLAYIGDEWPGEEVASVTAAYIAAGGLGGFLGRFLSGVVADHGGWQVAFLIYAAVTGVSAAYVAWALPRERNFVRAEGLRHSARLAVGHLFNPPIVATFAIGFAVLFSFVAVFTYVNFHLAAPPFELTTSALGSIFVVYLLAVVVTPMTGRWVRRFGRRALVIGAVALWCVGLLITLVPTLSAIIAGLAICAIAGFICQAAATGLLAQRAEAARSSALGLYVTCYYLGGSAGATAPAPVWERAGWPGCVALVILVLTAMAALVARFWRAERAGEA